MATIAESGKGRARRAVRAGPHGGEAAELTFVLNRAWRITTISPALAARWGLRLSRARKIDWRAEKLLPSGAFAAIDSALAGGEPVKFEWRAILEPGRSMSAEIRPDRDGVEMRLWETGGEVTPPHSTAQDQRTEVAVLDQQGDILGINEAWRTAYPQLEPWTFGVGRRYVDVCRRIIRDADLFRVAPQLAAVIAQGAPSFKFNCEIATHHGLRWRRGRIERIKLLGAPHYLVSHENLAEILRETLKLRPAA